jgi:tryptophanase
VITALDAVVLTRGNNTSLSHLDVTAESVLNVHDERAAAFGLEFTYDPDELRLLRCALQARGVSMRVP